MAELSSSNNPLTSNDTYTIKTMPGKYYSFSAAGTWGSGSLAINWTDAASNSVAFPDSPLTANGGFVLCAPTNTVSLVLTGATNPSLTITFSRVID